MSDPSCATNGTWDREDDPEPEHCGCTRLCEMGPTCPAASPDLPGAGCFRVRGNMPDSSGGDHDA
jgi:hypothetical protein